MKLNRTRRSASPETRELRAPLFTIDAGLIQTSVHDTVHALFAPLHYEPGYAYPLIIWLHGLGGDERQLMRIMPQISMRNYVAIAPRGTSEAGDGDRAGYRWAEGDRQVLDAEQRIFDCMAVAKQKLHVAEHRIFLGGFDCGATLALRVGLAHPEHFAGVISLCGALPRGQTPLCNLSQARRLPVLLAVGRKSLQYSPEAACEDLRLLHAAGMTVTLREYPSGQELSPQMLGDMDRWIIDQITRPSELVSSPTR